MKFRNRKKGAILLITSMTLSVASLLLAGLSTYVLVALNEQNASINRSEDTFELKKDINILSCYTTGFTIDHWYKAEVDKALSKGVITENESTVLSAIFGSTKPYQDRTQKYMWIWADGSNGNRFYQKSSDYSSGKYNIYYAEIYGSNKSCYAVCSLDFSSTNSPVFTNEIRNLTGGTN